MYRSTPKIAARIFVIQTKQRDNFVSLCKVAKHHRTQISHSSESDQQISLKAKERQPCKIHVNKKRNRSIEFYSSNMFFLHRKMIQGLRKLHGKSPDPCDLVLIVH